MTLSIFGGALFAAVLAFGQTAMAACQGYCADRRAGGLEFDSCTLTYDRNGTVIDQQCFYTSVKIIDEVALEGGAS
jgi:hypothetical protein